MLSADFHDRPLVTVAMAVFNGMPYLPLAIENILGQSYTNIDFLIIDDGSTDSSREVIRKYAKESDRIRYILKSANEGLSVVRNLSIKEALGDFLLMVDADDWMDERTIEKAVSKSLTKQADIVLWDYDTFYGDSPVPPKSSKKSILDSIDVSERFKLLGLPAFMPVRLIKTEYARTKHLGFPVGLTKQDIPVHWKIMTDSNAKIELLPEVLFHYRQHSATTSSRKGKSLFSLAYVMDIVKSNLMEDDLFEAYRDIYLKSRLQLLHGMYDAVQPSLKEDALTLIKDRMDDDTKDWLRSNKQCLTSRSQIFYGMLEGNLADTLKYKIFLATRRLYRTFKRK